SHIHGSGFHGSPLEWNFRNDERSCLCTISSLPPPRERSARINVGETPSAVTLCRSTNDQTRSGPGKSGAPSYRIIVAPSSNAPKTSHGPIIQPMSVIQQRVSSGCRSSPIHMPCADLIGKPQCVCTAPFGFPVVPEV